MWGLRRNDPYIVNECNILAQKEYKTRYDKMDMTTH